MQFEIYFYEFELKILLILYNKIYKRHNYNLHRFSIFNHKIKSQPNLKQQGHY
jgi:hypothetical protein